MQPPEPLRTRVFPEAGVGWRWAVVRVDTVLREGVKPTRDQAREAAAEAKRELEKQQLGDVIALRQAASRSDV